jgi:hypothetical protein
MGRAATQAGRIPNRGSTTTVTFQGEGGGLPAATWRWLSSSMNYLYNSFAGPQGETYACDARAVRSAGTALVFRVCTVKFRHATETATGANASGED